MESFIGRLHDDCLHEHPFAGYRPSRKIMKDWKTVNKATRSHTSLNGLTPMEFATRPREDHKEIQPTYK